MRSQKLIRKSFLHFFNHSKANWNGVSCLALGIILFSLTVASIADLEGIDRGSTTPEFDACAYQRFVLLYPDDEEDEQEEEAEEGFVQNFFMDWNTTEGKVVGARRFILRQEFQIEIDRINGVCKLQPKQLNKLAIASKGGVKKALKDWQQKTLARFEAFNGNQENDVEREPVEEEKYTDISAIDDQTLQLADNGFFGDVQNDTVANNSLWKKTLNSTLSKEQKDAWKAFITEQREVKREMMADATIASLNLKIGLTAEQKVEFTELVRPEILEAKLEMVENVASQYENYLYLYYASKVKNSKLKKILTESQMQLWKLTVSTAKQYGSLFERDNRVVRRNGNVWDQQGFELTMFIESAVEFVEELADFAVSIFKGRR